METDGALVCKQFAPRRGRFTGNKHRALASASFSATRLGEWLVLFVGQGFAAGEKQTRRLQSLLQEKRADQSAGVFAGGAQRLKINTQERQAEFLAHRLRRQAAPDPLRR